MSMLTGGEVPSWSLGDRLRKAREHARLTQSELAAQIGIARASVTNYETSRTSPARPVLLSWAMACGVNLDWLAGAPHPGVSNVAHRASVRKRERSTAPKVAVLVAA